MPAIGNAQTFQKVAPKPTPKPAPAGGSGTNPVFDATHGYTLPTPPRQVVPDARPHGTGVLPRAVPGYTQPKSAYQNPQSYATTVLKVFKAQPLAQQQAVVRGATQSPNTAESKVILQYVKQQHAGAGARGLAAIMGPGQAAVQAFENSGGTIDKIASNALSDVWNLAPGTVEGAYGLASKGLQGFSALTSGNLSGAEKAYSGAAHMLVDPYIQAAMHPLRSLEEHPVNTLLLAAGPKALIGRGAGFAMRSGALGETAARAASTVREPLSVGTIAGEPSPITESRTYSSDVSNKAFQVAREKVIKARGRNPNVSTPSSLPGSVAYALNRGTEAKLFRGTDEMTATHQMLHRADRNQAIQALQKAAPSKAAKDVVSFVGQRIIRKPETAVEDVTKEINRLKAAQAKLPRRSVELHQNRLQIKSLETALRTPGAFDEAFAADQHIAPFVNSQDAALQAKGFLDSEQAMRSKLFPYAQAHMGAKYDPVGQRLVDATGAELPTQAILDHLKENEVSDPMFVAHEMNKVGAGRFYKNYQLSRGTLNRNRIRTGKAFTQGAYDHSWKGLIGQVADRAQTLSRASLHDRVISRYGVRIPQTLEHRLGINKPPAADYTPEEAQRIARAAVIDDHGNQIPGALELTPIQRSAVHQLDAVRNLQSPRELANVSQVELKALADSIEQTAKRTDSHRNVVLVPSAVVKRFADQYAKTDSLLKGVGKVTQQFRRTVLPYSTHWMLQIGSEAALRTLLAGATHPDYLRTAKMLSEDLAGSPEGRAINAELTQSTLYSGGGSSIKEAAMGRSGRGALDVHNSNPGRISSAAKAFPPTKALIAAHNRYADTVTAAMYGLEHNARLMGLGKLAHKEIQSFGYSWSNSVRMEGRLVAQLADRMKADPALVARFGREVDNMFGKYSKFTPKQRAMIQSFTPFLPWYLSAAKYVFAYLPAHHPVATSLLASLRQTINRDVEEGKQAPLNVWAMQELARISPFGIFTPPSTKPSTGAALAGQQITGAFLPQIEGALNNLKGLNSFGDAALKGPNGDVKANTGPAGAAAAENALEAFLPLMRYVRLAEAGGRPTYGTSTIVSPQPKAGEKPGTAGSVLDRIFNPFYSVATEQADQGAPAYGDTQPASGGSTTPVIPGAGSTSGVVIPGEGSTNGVVIP